MPPMRPKLWVIRAPVPRSISLGDRAGFGLCALAGPGVRLGCDLERVERRSEAFVADYFTECERALWLRAPRAERSRLANLVWSAKESAVKALGGHGVSQRRKLEALP